MRLEVLGSAGAIATPQAGCSCPVCLEARAKGVSYSRTGPSVFELNYDFGGWPPDTKTTTRTRVLVAMDELYGRRPPDLGTLDLAYLPQGLAEHHPLTGERRIAAEHPLLRAEATFPQALEIVRALDAKRVVLHHIEELDGLSHDDLLAVADKVRTEEGLAIEFAYDTMVVEV